jgi:hypothetical protein
MTIFTALSMLQSNSLLVNLVVSPGLVFCFIHCPSSTSRASPPVIYIAMNAFVMFSFYLVKFAMKKKVSPEIGLDAWYQELSFRCKFPV